MRPQNYKISSDEAMDLVYYNQTVKDTSIFGILDFSIELFNHELNFENCIVHHLKAIKTQFNKQVKFLNCRFISCDFSFSFFPGGLQIVNCSFDNYLNFECGGHNEPKNSFKLENSIFKNFVNFYDCSYDGPFILKGNDFQNGTNILGNKNMPYEAVFKLTPLIENNNGALNVDGEGNKMSH